MNEGLQGARPRWPAWSWGLLGAILLVDLAWLAVTPLSLTPGSPGSLIETLCVAAVLALAGRSWRGYRAGPLAEGFGFFLATWPAIRLLSALMMTTDLPLADARLAGWDARLGFHWLAYVEWIDRHPWLMWAMQTAYDQLSAYSSVIFVAFVMLLGARRAIEYTLIIFITGVIVAITGALLPALGAMPHYAPDPHMFAHVRTSFGTSQIEVLRQLRANRDYVITLDSLPGLVAFPSFHTAVGVISIFCAWGRKRIFVPVLSINLLMIASTPLFGSHYLVDIFAGALLALTVAAAVRAASPRQMVASTAGRDILPAQDRVPHRAS